jgi:diacylglycerol kinase family enzyme
VAEVEPARRLAAIAGIPMLAAALLVTVVTLYRNLLSLSIGLPGLMVLAGAMWWVVTEISVRRVLGVLGSLVGLAGVAVAMAMSVSRPEHWVLRTSIIVAVLLSAFGMARYSLIRSVPHQAGCRPKRPVLLCNPWSGGGKVERFDLVARAAELGVEVVMLEEGLDLEELTRAAVARGADCLGMAGGDGSQALVASVAVEHGLPFVCIPAGTRNHFALDLGLDRDDPGKALIAFRDGVERRVDYATVNDRLFVNNVSLGLYATIVQSEDYRDAKVDVTRSMLTQMLGRQAEPFDLQYTTDAGVDVDGAFLVMVSNNPYVLGVKRDVSQRRELDSGRLGIFGVSTQTGVQAARLVALSALGLRSWSKHWYEFTARDFDVRSRSGSAFLGVDGEALEEDTPLQFRCHPGGLRMLVPPRQPACRGTAPGPQRPRARRRRRRARTRPGPDGELTCPAGDPPGDPGHHPAEHPTGDHVARIVHTGVHAGEGHRSGQRVQGDPQLGQLPADGTRERRRGRSVPGRERAGLRMGETPAFRHGRRRPGAPGHALHGDVGRGRGHGDRRDAHQRGPALAPSLHSHTCGQEHPQHGVRGDPGQRGHHLIQNR